MTPRTGALHPRTSMLSRRKAPPKKTNQKFKAPSFSSRPGTQEGKAGLALDLSELLSFCFAPSSSAGGWFGHPFGVYLSPLQRGIPQNRQLCPEVLGGSKEAQESTSPLLQPAPCQPHQPCSPRQRAAGGDTALRSSHRMVGIGRDLCGSSSPTPLLKQGHLQ